MNISVYLEFNSRADLGFGVERERWENQYANGMYIEFSFFLFRLTLEAISAVKGEPEPEKDELKSTG